MKKVKLDILGLSSSVDSQTGSFALVLKENKGDRRLPIIIGMFEAQSIAMEIEKIVPNRPMTHDLFKSFLKKINFVVNEVLITDIKDGVFFSKIIISDSNKKHSIDARPSDAIAIAIRYKANIYVDERVLDEAGIIFDEAEVDKKVNDDGKVKTLKDFSIKELNKKLTDSIAEENYEFAARVRDEIKRRN
tara:strand:- start:1360 stop:1929 length:570 start_codon:yes stop_codon:yes gene_type:complete